MLNLGVLYCFYEKVLFLILLYKLTKSHKKAMSKVRTIVCCSKYYKNYFRYEAKAPRREVLANDNSALQFASMKSFKMFTICEICPADHLKVGEKEVIFFYLKFGHMNCFYQQALGRAQICLMVQKILGNSI